MKDYIEERVIELANYIISSGSTVRHPAHEFNISKSTVHTARAKQKQHCRNNLAMLFLSK